jgi:transcriptional regulator with XRE-family HTH domain
MGDMVEAPSLGDQIRDARERRHQTQQQAADIVGVDRKTWDNWEHNRTRPRNRMGALKAWAPELDTPAPDPLERDLRDFLQSRMEYLSPQERQQWIDLYRAQRRAAAPRRAG